MTPPRLDPPQLSVVVPCYNEAGNIAELCRRLGACCRQVAGDSYEIVLVNDGSRDSTWAEMLAATERDPRVLLVDLSRNHGHQLALSAGLSLCSGERILVIDADLQDPPELLPEMMALMDQGADVVYGQRTERDGETWFKRVTASAFYRLLNRLSHVEVPVDTGDFRLMSRRVCDALMSMPEQHRFIRGMVAWIGFRQVPIAYRRAPRHAGSTNYTFARMLNFSFDALTGFSIQPLRLTIYAGLVTAFLAFLVLVWVLVTWLDGHTVQGWTSTMATLLAVSALQMIFLGVIGEYVGRAFMEAKRRPLFLIREVVRNNAPAARREPAEQLGEPTRPGGSWPAL